MIKLVSHATWIVTALVIAYSRGRAVEAGLTLDAYDAAHEAVVLATQATDALGRCVVVSEAAGRLLLVEHLRIHDRLVLLRRMEAQ